MKNAEKNRDPERARKRAMSDARCAWRKMTEDDRAAFLTWAASQPGWPSSMLMEPAAHVPAGPWVIVGHEKDDATGREVYWGPAGMTEDFGQGKPYADQVSAWAEAEELDRTYCQVRAWTLRQVSA